MSNHTAVCKYIFNKKLSWWCVYMKKKSISNAEFQMVRLKLTACTVTMELKMAMEK